MTANVRLLVGTRKAAFIYSSDERRKKWSLSEPIMPGWAVYNMAAEGKVVVSMLGLTDDQSEQPAILPFASVRINRRSTPPAPKLAVDAATM